METTPTPNSPQELFDIQKGVEPDRSSLPSLVEAVDEFIGEFDPDPLDVVPVAVLILERLERFHFDVLHSGEGDDLTPWQRKTWEEDLRNLTKALKFVRLVRVS